MFLYVALSGLARQRANQSQVPSVSGGATMEGRRKGGAGLARLEGGIGNGMRAPGFAVEAVRRTVVVRKDGDKGLLQTGKSVGNAG